MGRRDLHAKKHLLIHLKSKKKKVNFLWASAPGIFSGIAVFKPHASPKYIKSGVSFSWFHKISKLCLSHVSPRLTLFL